MRLSSLFIAAALLTAPALAAAQTWEPISHDEGIKVWQREVHGTSLVEFRGRAQVNSSIKQILAVLNDADRKTEWMQNCIANYIVRARKVGDRVVYNRTEIGFPMISDRDVVVQTSLSVWPEKRRVRIDAWNVEDPLAPASDEAVRMPKLLLSWILVADTREKTTVTYQVQADPGGAIPSWLVNMASKKLPHNTLANLRKQAAKDYSKSMAVVDASFDWSLVGM